MLRCRSTHAAHAERRYGFLAQCFRNTSDAASLFAGDADYVPLVTEVKRHGKLVIVCFFPHIGLNPVLRRAADAFMSEERQVQDLVVEITAPEYRRT